MNLEKLERLKRVKVSEVKVPDTRLARLWDHAIKEAYEHGEISHDEFKCWEEYLEKTLMYLEKVLTFCQRELEYLKQLKETSEHDRDEVLKILERIEEDEELRRMRHEIAVIKEKINVIWDDLVKVKEKAINSLLGFTYPHSENGVIFAFGCLYRLLNPILAEFLGEESFDKLEFRTEFPDAELVKGRKKLRIEFEVRSGDFKRHFHNEKGCDLIICWTHDWPGCPLKVLELRELWVYEPISD